MSGNSWVKLCVDGILTCSAQNSDNDVESLRYVQVGLSYSDAPLSSSSMLYMENFIIDDSH